MVEYQRNLYRVSQLVNAIFQPSKIKFFSHFPALINWLFRVKEVDQQSKKLLLDLEWNPRSIYQTIIQREETETGVKSSKNHDASAEECLENDEVREIMTKNLSTLSRLVEGKG